MTDKHDEKAREIIIKHTAIVHPEGTTVNFADLAEAIAADRRQVERENVWRRAVIDALVASWIYRKEHDDDPHKALHDLACNEQRIALDPAISKDARNLIQKGWREALERAAKVCEKRASLDESEYDSYLESMNSGDIAAAASDRESRGCAKAIRALIESEKVQEGSDGQIL